MGRWSPHDSAVRNPSGSTNSSMSNIAEHVLHFPRTQAVGVLERIIPGGEYDGRIERQVEARGTIIIPAEGKRLLIVDSEHTIDLAALGNLQPDDLQGLYLPPYATNEDLAFITKLTGLEDLNLPSPSVDDAGLGYLAGLHNLKRLDISSTRVAGVGLMAVSQLPSLEILSLFGTAIRDQGLAYLSSFASLQVLSLGATSITDSGLQRLQYIPNLLSISLEETNITNDGLLHIQYLRITLKTRGQVYWGP